MPIDAIDPIELELMRNLFEAAAEEMGIVLLRVAFSANIKERRDFSCAVFNAGGELLAQAAHIPVHLGSMPASVAAVRERLGTLDDGDVAIVNDPFAGGTHLPDITIVSPVYHDGVLLGYAANRAHHADVGGVSPGSMTLSRHIDEEGVRIEPSLLVRRGVRDEALLGRVLAAVRTPDERLGDLDAQIAANAVGAAALRRTAAAWGRPAVERYGRALLDYAAAFMARTIDAIPDGEWSFEDALDDDGAGGGPVRLRVRLRVTGDRATVDLTASDDQVPGCVNCPEAVTRSAVYYCFVCLLDHARAIPGPRRRRARRRADQRRVLPQHRSPHPPRQRPARPLPRGRRRGEHRDEPAGGGRGIRRAGAGPAERIPAASCGTMNSVALGGDAPGAGRWTYYETIGGGSGAGPLGPGAPAVQCHMTNTLNTPAEAIELQYPLRVRRFERTAHTGGPGRHRGGDGIVREIEALAPCEGTILSDRRASQPYGLARGASGAAGVNTVVSPDGTTSPLPGKGAVALRPGDRLRVQTPGGGGWGAE